MRNSRVRDLRLTRDYSEIAMGSPRKATLTPYYTRIRTAAAGEQPPEIGQVSELVRNTLTKEYGIYPPNLSTAIQNDGTIILTAVNPQSGLNLQIQLKNLAGNLIAPGGGVTPGVVPIEGQGGAPPPPAPAPGMGGGGPAAPPPGGF